MKRIIYILMACVATLVACTNSKQADTSRETLRIGVMPSVDHLPLILGLEKHYFDSLGLDLELVHFSSPMERDAALQAGELDGTISDYTTVMLQNQKGLPVQMLFATNGMFELLVSPTAGLKSVAELKAKRVGLSSNTVIDFATDAILQSAGLQASDVEKVEVQKIPLRLEMLVNGELDAAVLPQPFVGLGLSRGLTIPQYQTKYGTASFPITGLAIDTKQTKDKASAIEKLIAGYNQAVNYLNTTDVSEWAGIVAEKLKMDEGIVRSASFGTFAPARSPLAEDNPYRSIVGDVATWLAGKGLIPSSYQGEEAISPILPRSSTH